MFSRWLCQGESWHVLSLLSGNSCRYYIWLLLESATCHALMFCCFRIFFSIWLCFADLDCYRYDREWMTSYKSIHGHVADWYPVLRVYCFILSQLFFAIQSCLNLCLHVFVFTMLKYTCEMFFFSFTLFILDNAVWLYSSRLFNKFSPAQQ